MPSASETIAMAVTKGVAESVRMANLRLRTKALDEPRYGGVYRLGRNARLLHERLQPRAISGRFAATLSWLRAGDAERDLQWRTSSGAVCSQRIETRLLRRSRKRCHHKCLILLALRTWLAALDDFRNWLIREAA